MLQIQISSSDVLRIETEDIIEHYPSIVTLNKVFLLMAKLFQPLSNIVASYLESSSILWPSHFPHVLRPHHQPTLSLQSSPKVLETPLSPVQS